MLQVFFEELHCYKLTWSFVINLEHPASQGPAIVLAITIFIPLGDETEGLKPEALYQTMTGKTGSEVNKRSISFQAQILPMPSLDRTNISSKDALLLLQPMGCLD